MTQLADYREGSSNHEAADSPAKFCVGFVSWVWQAILMLLAILPPLSCLFIRNPVPRVSPATPSLFGAPLVRIRVLRFEVSGILIGSCQRSIDSPPLPLRRDVSCARIRSFLGGFSDG